MKLILTLAATAALAASPVLAQAPASTGFGKPFGIPASSANKPRDYGIAPPVGSSGSSSSRPKTYGAPDAGGGFKPYQPYKPGSVYASPKPPSSGAKPCETSVYVNACDKRR